MLNGLNATNLLLLTGAGSSFCVVNAAASKLKVKTAPGLTDLWNAAKDGMGAPAFDKVLGIIPNGTKITEIEKLLTQCKLYVARLWLIMAAYDIEQLLFCPRNTPA